MCFSRRFHHPAHVTLKDNFSIFILAQNIPTSGFSYSSYLQFCKIHSGQNMSDSRTYGLDSGSLYAEFGNHSSKVLNEVRMRPFNQIT